MLCISDAKLISGIQDLERNKHQLLHRIQSVQANNCFCSRCLNNVTHFNVIKSDPRPPKNHLSSFNNVTSIQDKHQIYKKVVNKACIALQIYHFTVLQVNNFTSVTKFCMYDWLYFHSSIRKLNMSFKMSR